LNLFFGAWKFFVFKRVSLRMTEREIRKVLDQNGVLPSRQLGQNFLTDATVAREIVDFLDITLADTVVEVGPGTGALTEHVIGRARRVILIEFDSRLAAALRLKFADRDDVEVVHQDAAEFDMRRLFAERPVKFLGNLPYSSGGAIMRNLLSVPHPFSKAVIMLQKEVIDRLSAGPGTKDYGLLSLRMQSAWHVETVKAVPPEVFFPQPQVDSLVALLTPRVDLPAFDRRLLDELLRRGFGQRRKQLKKLMPDTVAWEDLITSLAVPETVRAEELDLLQWVKITQMYDDHPLKNIPQKHSEIFDLVDENDQVIGQSTRGEIHENKKLHRAVHVFVFNKRKSLLLQLRSRWKDNHPGVWDSSAAGHLDAGEPYFDCAVRELQEEMGIEQSHLVEIGKLSPSSATGMEFITLYVAQHDGALRYPCSEVETVQWFPMEIIDQWLLQSPQDFATGFIECWRLFRAL
jgi:16S rRNA (adenine1518-N6/adenine1519-N6)-dimethyltransferase